MNRSLKIFLACALGGGIGTFVSLQLAAKFWFLGLFVGGIVGYVYYDFKLVIFALREAWIAIVPSFQIRKVINVLLQTLSAILLVISIFASAGLFFWLDFKFANGVGLTEDQKVQLFFALCILFIILLLYAAWHLKPADKEAGGEVKGLLKGALWLSPPAIFVLWPIRLVRDMPAFFLCFCKFCKIVFIIIHSEIRLLCMLDAAIGAGIGYWFGNVFIGAAAGGAFGVFSYLAITKWFLKLEPAK